MFAQCSSKYCEVDCAAWGVRASTRVELAGVEMNKRSFWWCVDPVVFMWFKEHTTKGLPECHDSMPSIFSGRATTLCNVFDPACVCKLYEGGEEVGVTIVM